MESVDDESVEVLLDVAHSERQLRLDSLDSLDAKAGVLIGFAGVLVALTTTLPDWWHRLLVLLPALASATVAFDALRVKKLPGFNLQVTRDKCGAALTIAASICLVIRICGSVAPYRRCPPPPGRMAVRQATRALTFAATEAEQVDATSMVCGQRP